MVTSVHFDRNLDVQVSCPEDLKVRGLPFLENILINLLDNAVRYTPPDAEPLVRVRVEDRSDSDERGVHLQVRGGRPVDDALLSRVFDRYVRGPGSKGLGLGLALVREIVEAAGGRVEAGNAEEGGRKMFEARISLPPE
jgi:signal transduction histidine kinase